MKPSQCVAGLIALLAVSSSAFGARVASTVAPPSAPVVQAFFDYLLTPGTNIATDIEAKDRWLAPSLRRLLDATTASVAGAQKTKGADTPDPMLPDNATFLDSWDPPTSCVATRPADREGKGPVPVVCTWGPGTNYPGQSKKLAVTLERAGAGWLIRGIRYFESSYSRANDIEQELRAIIVSTGGTVPADEPPGRRGLIATEGETSAVLVFTKDADFGRRWYSTTAPPHVPTVSINNVLHAGERAFVYLTFNRPGTDEEGIADLSLAIEITDPDGRPYGKFSDLPAMEPGFQPKPELLYLAQPHVEIRIEDKDPEGIYRIVATLHDKVRDVSLVTESTFVVVKAKASR